MRGTAHLESFGVILLVIGSLSAMSRARGSTRRTAGGQAWATAGKLQSTFEAEISNIATSCRADLGTHTAHCDCRGLPGGPPALAQDDKHTAGSETTPARSSPESVSKREPGPSEPEPCVPGKTCCGEEGTNDQKYIYACDNQSKKWYKAIECRSEHGCQIGDNGHGFCA
jgi:hypothetical protein